MDQATKEELWRRVMDGEMIKDAARDLGIKYSNAKNIIQLGRKLQRLSKEERLTRRTRGPRLGSRNPKRALAAPKKTMKVKLPTSLITIYMSEGEHTTPKTDNCRQTIDDLSSDSSESFHIDMWSSRSNLLAERKPLLTTVPATQDATPDFDLINCPRPKFDFSAYSAEHRSSSGSCISLPNYSNLQAPAQPSTFQYLTLPFPVSQPQVTKH